MYYFIVNLTSRTGKTQKIWTTLEQELIRRKVEYQAYMTDYKGHAGELATMICEKSHEQFTREGIRICLVVVGGDGTVNEVINGMNSFSEITFGYIPAGSGNDLGRGLGISKDPMEALGRILESREPMAMDLGEVTLPDGSTHYFAISSGIGIDAEVCRMALTSKLKVFLNHLGLGSLTYVLLTVKALFTMPTTEIKAVFDDQESRDISKMIFVAGMNHPWEGGGVPMAPQASAQDGKLSVCCVYGIPRWRAFFLLPVLISAKHQGHKGFEIIDCTSYRLQLKDPMVVHGDGEYLGEQILIQYRCLPGMLQMQL